MLAAFYTVQGTARDVLRVAEMPTPEPAAGEVRVKIARSGVNPSDVKSRRGGPGRKMAFPLIVPHSDGAGLIDAVGAGVPESRVGERVWIWNGQWKRPLGTAAEFICLHASQAVSLPDGIDLDAGACLGIPALTAWRGVTIHGPVAGKRLLVAAGAGAVGHYAVQIAKSLGAEVIATVSSAEKADIARAAGADHTINYRAEDVAARVADITGGIGVDHMVEVDLAANAHLIPGVVRPAGSVAVYGTGQPTAELPVGPLIARQLKLEIFIVYELSPAAREEAQSGITALLEAGKLSHPIAARYPLGDIAEAHEAVESGRMIGNVVVTLDGAP